MLMLRMTGGLGNQMFQYAIYQELLSRGKEVCIDDFTEYDGSETHHKSIEKVFGVTYRKGTLKEYNRLTDSSKMIFKRVKRKLLGRKQKVYQEKDAIKYEEKVFGYEDAYLIGYFQSEKYFSGVHKLIRKQFAFKEELITDKAKEYLESIESGNSISVHIRRGDYVKEKFASIYGGICTTEYYQSAMKYMRQNVDNPKFFLFTNDPEWVKENMLEEDCVLVEGNDESTGYIDMMLMSRCKHNIIANSSFSWWGAWLNSYSDKIVVAPSKWLNNTEEEDIFADCMNVRFNAAGEKVHE